MLLVVSNAVTAEHDLGSGHAGLPQQRMQRVRRQVR
jgi:hypothetical protein